MLHEPLPAFIADNIVQDRRYEPPVVAWRDVNYEAPNGDVVALQTPYGYFIHCMLRKDGTRATWEEQGERWTDGRFEYSDVTHWVRLV